jgi:hypothetical protein
VFSPALADLDEHLPALPDRAAFGDVLVNLLDEHEKRLFLFFGLGEQVPRDGGQHLPGLVFVEERRDVEDYRHVLF